MPGEKKRDRLVAQLLVGHARAVFVLRVKKHREKITGVAAASAAFADDTVENALDEGDFALDAKVGGRGHPMWNKKGAPEIGAEFEQQLKRFSDVRSEEHTSELQSRQYLVCRLLLEKKKK